MSTDEPAPQPVPHLGRPLESQDIPWPARARVLGVWLVSGLAVILILVAQVPFAGQVTVAEGEVAQRDIVAPRQITFVSEILTQQRRDMAVNAVPDVYDPPQPRIGRQQLTLAGQAHGTLSRGCMPKVVARFIEAGGLDGLDTTCLAQVKPQPFFLDLAGPQP